MTASAANWTLIFPASHNFSAENGGLPRIGDFLRQNRTTRRVLRYLRRPLVVSSPIAAYVVRFADAGKCGGSLRLRLANSDRRSIDRRTVRLLPRAACRHEESLAGIDENLRRRQPIKASPANRRSRYEHGSGPSEATPAIFSRLDRDLDRANRATRGTPTEGAPGGSCALAKAGEAAPKRLCCGCRP